jgi:hypothetical protein
MDEEKYRGVPTAEFDKVLQAKIAELKRQGQSKAAICERSFEIEDEVVTDLLERKSNNRPLTPRAT